MDRQIEFEVRGDAAGATRLEPLLREQFENVPELRVESSAVDRAMGMSGEEIAITFVVSLLASTVVHVIRNRIDAAVRAVGDATGTHLRLLFPSPTYAESEGSGDGADASDPRRRAPFSAPGNTRVDDPPASPREASPPQKVRILFLGANSTVEPLDLEHEFSRIEDNLARSRGREALELKQVWAVTVDRLTRALLDEAPTIVHFSGHGNTDGIVLRDELGEPSPVRGEELAGLFALFKDTVQCVVLNACYSEVQAKAIRSHIPHVIGLPSEVEDSAAIAFSTGFYQAIGAGKEIPFAFELGKQRARMEGVTGDVLPIRL